MIERDVNLRVDNLKLVGRLYLPGVGRLDPYPAVCVCHGIPLSEEAKTNVDERGYPVLAEQICRAGFAVMIFNFRGTGASEGNFDLLGWTRDLGAAIDFLWSLPEVDHSRFSLLGFSGGAAVSVCVAAEDKRVSAVIACACPAEFDSLKSVTDSDEPGATIDHFRRVGIIRDQEFPPSAEEWFESFRRVMPATSIAKIAPRPLLLVHGGQDEVVDVGHAYQLYAQAGEPRQLIIVQGVGHRLRQDERAIAIVVDWLKTQAR
jgi:dipeptidyl aminopeptidase/acylaminoacyl peptidase